MDRAFHVGGQIRQTVKAILVAGGTVTHAAGMDAHELAALRAEADAAAVARARRSAEIFRATRYASMPAWSDWPTGRAAETVPRLHAGEAHYRMPGWADDPSPASRPRVQQHRQLGHAPMPGTAFADF